jgi:DNA-binding MarR family transcriptional regulator
VARNLVIRQDAVNQAQEICSAYSALLDEIVQFAGVLDDVRNDLARPTGQSLARCQVLAAIEQEPVPVGAIACDLGHARQSVQRVADLLVQDGLGQYRPNPAHQRAKLLEITPAGRDVLAQLAEAQNACNRRTVEGLDAARLTQARETLTELRQRLESQLD